MCLIMHIVVSAEIAEKKFRRIFGQRIIFGEGGQIRRLRGLQSCDVQHPVHDLQHLNKIQRLHRAWLNSFDGMSERHINVFASLIKSCPVTVLVVSL